MFRQLKPRFAAAIAHFSQDLNFEVFNVVVLILAIIVVGNFLRDKKSNYLEGSLCILVYVIIAVSMYIPLYFGAMKLTRLQVAAYYYPNPTPGGDNSSEGSTGSSSETGGEAAAATTEAALRFLLRR